MCATPPCAVHGGDLGANFHQLIVTRPAVDLHRENDRADHDLVARPKVLLSDPPEELGTVYVAYSKHPEILESRRYRFEGGRLEVRVAAAKAALAWLRDVLRETDDGGALTPPQNGTSS